jgi:hypothetical protein
VKLSGRGFWETPSTSNGAAGETGFFGVFENDFINNFIDSPKLLSLSAFFMLLAALGRSKTNSELFPFLITSEEVNIFSVLELR